MDWQRACFPYSDWRKPDPNDWSVASVDSPAPWYTEGTSTGPVPPVSALTPGLITEFTNLSFWTVKDGVPVPIHFNRILYLSQGFEAETPDLELEEISHMNDLTPKEIRDKEVEKVIKALEDTSTGKFERFSQVRGTK
jgi:hypothetical protein